MKRLLPLLLLLAACSTPEPETEPAATTAAPTGSDIHLFSLSGDGAQPIARITDRDGYDNQPSFTSDGGMVLFTSDRTGNMDSWAYDVSDGSLTQLTDTPPGEYSPTVLPDEPSWFSVVRLDSTGLQTLWRHALSGDGEPALVADIDRIGYFTWVGNDRVLFFRLGSPATLQLVTEGTGDTTVVATRVGRSLHRVPGQQASSYIQVQEDDSREILRWDWNTGENSAIAVPLEGGQDYAWTPDGALVMAVEGELYRYKPGESVDWSLVADLDLDGTSRLAVSPDGTLLAVVANR
ncbi:MAG: PD40 domain-containing protein [Rhodothermales bacterium]|nr:PD40 domain-containing protein [Rhodothermales bacterium]MBO6779696.1 PD40 domain-containing protein [Rhodothermales bacterium]